MPNEHQQRRLLPAHRIVGGGLGRRYDLAAQLSDHRYDDHYHHRQQQQQLGRSLVAGMAPSRLTSPPGLEQAVLQEAVPEAVGAVARRVEPPEQRRPHEDEEEERGAALALLSPPPPPPRASAVVVPAADVSLHRQPEVFTIGNMRSSNSNSTGNRSVPPPPAAPPPSPPGTGAREGGGDPGLGNRTGRPRPAAAVTAAAAAARVGADSPPGLREGRREVCPPRGRQARVLPLTARNCEGSTVASLVSLCLEAMVAAWDSHGVAGGAGGGYLPRAYHMPHELCARLLRLLISSKKLTAFTLSGFLSPAALEVDLSGCSYVPKSVFKQLGFCCPRIIHLNFSRCSQVNNSIVRSVLQGCSALRQLYLDGCRHVTDAGFHLQQSPFYVLVGAVSLETISVQGCPQVTGELVLHLRKVCRNLKELDLARCKSVTSASVRRLFDSCPSLESLNLSFLESVVDEAFEDLPAIDMGKVAPPATRTGGPPARAILSAVTDDETRQPLVALPQHNPDTAGAPTPALAGAGEGGARRREREWQRQQHGSGLSFSVAGDGGGGRGHGGGGGGGVVSTPNSCLFCSIPPSSSWLSGSSFSLPALRHLNLGRCQGVTDLALARVAGAFSGLEGLHLEHCLGVTDTGVTALAAGCRRLRALGLRNCGQITDIALEALSVHCVLLEWLDVSWCGGVTDRGFERLAEGCSGLEEVQAVWCESITDATLSALSRACTRLESVHVARCAGVSAASVAALRTSGVEVVVVLR